MAAIRTQGGSVLTKEGRVSCDCCNLFTLPLNIGEIGDCACDNVELRCFSEEFPAPNPWNPSVYGIAKNNPVNRTFRLQGEIQDFNQNGAIIGWTNLVSVPTVVTINGSIGGEIAVQGYRSSYSPEQPSQEAPEFTELVDLGGFDCGICPIPAPEPRGCNFQISWVMYPNMAYIVYLISSYYLLRNEGQPDEAKGICVPWLRATLTGRGSGAP